MNKISTIIFRMNAEDHAALKEIALSQHVSVSELIRSATVKKYKLKGEKIKKFHYVSDRRPTGRKKSDWTQAEIALLVKLYEPKKRGCKEKIAKQLRRSYSAVKHKVHTLQLARIA